MATIIGRAVSRSELKLPNDVAGAAAAGLLFPANLLFLSAI
jgi:hypothetical protein